MEIIIVNDGSLGDSIRIAKDLTKDDSRFIYIDKENGGVSSARNLGIERSKGQYITFIDSDDWVDSEYLEVLYRALIEEKADIAITTYKQFNMDDNCYYVYSYQRGMKNEFLKNIS